MSCHHSLLPDDNSSCFRCLEENLEKILHQHHQCPWCGRIWKCAVPWCSKGLDIIPNQYDACWIRHITSREGVQCCKKMYDVEDHPYYGKL
jgi:hypothetical protein